MLFIWKKSKAHLTTSFNYAFNWSNKATEAAIDLAIFLRIPFAVVPCCVFPSEFPNRTYGGKTVKSYNEFLSYLLCKNCKIRRGELSFVGSDTAKNVVLYMLLEDFEVQSVT